MKLKNLVLPLLVSMNFVSIKAQDLKTTTTDSVVTTLKDTLPAKEKFSLNRAYIGSLSSVNFNANKLSEVTPSTSVRTGVDASYTPASWFSLKSRAILDGSSETTPYSLEMFATQFNPTDNISVSVGKLGRASASLRPHPVSGNGHFETDSEARIPGLGVGGRVDAKFGTTSAAVSTTVNKDDKVEYNARVTLDQNAKTPVNMAAWYTDKKNFGGAVTGATGDFSTVAVYKQTTDQQIAADKLIWNPKGSEYFFYADQGYEINKGKFIRSEVGALVADEVKVNHVPVGILMGAGYDALGKQIKAYLFVTLEYKKK